MMNKNLKQIQQLRKEEKTYQQIGDILGLSRQRIHKIYNDGKMYQSIKKIELECPTCKTKFKVHPCKIKRGRKYCSYECYLKKMNKVRHKTEKERKKAKRIQQIQINKRWYEKLKKDPIRYTKYLKGQKEYQKNRKMNNGAKLIK